MNTFITRGRIIAAGLLALAGLVFYLFYSYSFIEVTVGSAASGQDISYTFDSQAKTEPKPVLTGKNTVKKLARRGNYEIIVRQGDTGYFELINNRGFLTTARVSAELKPEFQRTFIGNDPRSCLYKVQQVLMSAVCGDSLKELYVHRASDDRLPTHTVKAATPLVGYIEGSFTSADGKAMLLVGAPLISEEEEAPHTVYELTPDGDTINGRVVEGLVDGVFYRSAPYKNGLILYTVTHGQAYYFDGTSNKATRLELDRPDGDKLRLNSVNAYQESVLAVYSAAAPHVDTDVSSAAGDAIHSHAAEGDSDGGSSRAVFRQGDLVVSQNFDAESHNIWACGDRLLCALIEDRLNIYTIGDGKFDLLYGVSGVRDVLVAQNKLYLVRAEGVFGFDTQSRKGTLVYSFGGYNYCGSKLLTESLLVCVQFPDGRQSILDIAPSSNVQDAIDKKILQLQKNPAVRGVSIYGNQIYISPNAGELQYLPALGGYGYDPAALERANQDVNKAVRDLGIDPNKYKLSIPLSR